MSEIFPFVRIERTEVGVLRLRSPWAIRRERLNGGGLYAVRRGKCWVEIDDPPWSAELSAGDVLGVAKHRDHTLLDSPSTPRPERLTSLGLRPVSGDGGGDPDADTTEILVFWSAGTHPLESVFPPMAYVPGDGSRASESIRRALALVEFELADAGRPGSDSIIHRLAEILVIELIRAVMARSRDANPAWLQALGDPSVMRAVATMHERPDRPWTVHGLAKLAGLSRSAFVARFRRTVGEAPMQHLLRTRMQRAALALVESRHALPAIAESVGYESESAFYRAFRRIYGITPGDWRSAHQQPPPLSGARPTPPG
jgi:AraC-like DNA-binding protein